MDEICIKVLAPRYMKDFKCLGPLCGESCCNGWNIDIDRITYNKYRAEWDPEFKKLFKENIVLCDNTLENDISARVKLNEELVCPFLTKDKLCLIQLRKGEAYLSDVCFSFPRICFIINGVLEKSSTLACLEAARLALLNPEGIEFIEYGEPYKARKLVKGIINTNDPSLAEKTAKYFIELRNFSINVLKQRKYPLCDRLVFLGMFFRDIDSIVAAGKLDMIQALIDSHINKLSDVLYMQKITDTPIFDSMQIASLMKLLLLSFEEANNKSYREFFIEFTQGLQFLCPEDPDEIIEHYYEACRYYYLPFIEEHGYIFENYLVNYVFRNLFPINSGEQPMFDEYLILVLHYAILKIQLIGLSIYHKGLTTDLVIKMIVSFSKSLEHNPQYFLRLLKLLKQNNLASMENMAALFKDQHPETN